MWQGSPMRPRARLRAQFGAPSVDKALGALPVIADLCRRLDLAGIIDRACPVLEVARLHWDLTSISLYGAYPDPDDGFPTPRYGHPKDRRPDLKQVQTGLAV